MIMIHTLRAIVARHYPGWFVVSRVVLQQLYRVTGGLLALSRRHGGQTDKRSR